jgi:2,4-dienoyl-CoA reductase (NADPH2)
MNELRGKEPSMIFTPVEIGNVTFKNRILRSSIGGRMAYYDGAVNAAWVNFERRFALSGVAGLISATFTVDDERWSPLEYPKISNDTFIGPLKRAIKVIKDAAPDCKYIIQIGDPGCHTQTSLFSQRADAASASAGFDFLYGYRNRIHEMPAGEISQTITEFVAAARRVQDTGCDGLEITASKGYLIHQFLNPATNRRTDAYGGSTERRFRLLGEIVSAVRKQIGPNFLLGVRLSAVDDNLLPLNVRLPLTWNLRYYFVGNDLRETIQYARELKALGVDYLHVTRGFGFINPRENPGALPIDELRMFANSTRHLSAKAAVLAMLFNVLPNAAVKLLIGWGWTSNPAKVRQGANADWAEKIKEAAGIPVIANGGFRDRWIIEDTLRQGKCDLMSMA